MNNIEKTKEIMSKIISGLSNKLEPYLQNLKIQIDYNDFNLTVECEEGIYKTSIYQHILDISKNVAISYTEEDISKSIIELFNNIITKYNKNIRVVGIQYDLVNKNTYDRYTYLTVSSKYAVIDITKEDEKVKYIEVPENEVFFRIVDFTIKKNTRETILKDKLKALQLYTYTINKYKKRT